MKDLQGREYAKLADLKPGDKIQVDGDFTCAAPWSTHGVKHDDDFYFECAEGRHYIAGQVYEDGSLLGIYNYSNWMKEE